jgi:hypothetical protein
MATRQGFNRTPLLFFTALEELIESDVYSSTNEKMLPIVSKFFPSAERQPAVRIHQYAQCIVPSYSDSTFRSHFRLSRNSAEILVGLLARCPEIPSQHLRGRPPVSVEKQLLITMWVLGNPETIRSVSDRFNVTKSSVFRIVRRICHAIVNNLAAQFICWPRGERLKQVTEQFQRKKGLPHCIGAIDGTHIPIKAPYDNPEQYVNRKKFHSIQLQGVCDADRFFTDVYCAYPGSVHDARVLRNSPLYQDAQRLESVMFPESTYIIGDAAYPLKTWLVTGFKNNGKLTREQKQFNYLLSSTRMKIEHTFGLLKGRFRKLKVMMDIDKVEDIPLIVTSACVLHNFCLVNEDNIDMFLDSDIEQEVNNFQNIFVEQENAKTKRAEIMQLVV